MSVNNFNNMSFYGKNRSELYFNVEENAYGYSCLNIVLIYLEYELDRSIRERKKQDRIYKLVANTFSNKDKIKQNMHQVKINHRLSKFFLIKIIRTNCLIKVRSYSLITIRLEFKIYSPIAILYHQF